MVLFRVCMKSFSAFQPLLVTLYVSAALVGLGLTCATTEYCCLALCYVQSIACYFLLSRGVVTEMCQYLDIGFLTIKRKKQADAKAH